MQTPEAYDVLYSVADLIDSLCVSLIKCAHANHAILDERKKPAPDAQAIANFEWIARTSGERRVMLKDEINRRINEAIQRGGMRAVADARTYDLRGVQ